jgi:hypothetical protein
VSAPIALLAVLLKFRLRKHTGGGYGGRYDAPARMSIMSYAAANALAGRNKQSVVESATSVVERTDLADRSSSSRGAARLSLYVNPLATPPRKRKLAGFYREHCYHNADA